MEDVPVTISFPEKKDLEGGKDVKCRSRQEKWKQFRATFAVSYLCITAGQTLSFTSTAIPSMLEDWVSFPGLTPQHISWIGGLTPLGALFGSLIGILFIRRFSSKYTILCFASPIFFLSYLIIAFSSKYIARIFVGRFLGGIGIGLVTSSSPLYVIEVASDRYRGCLGILPQFLMIFGILLSNLFGTFLNWRLLAIASFIIALPSVPLLLFAPNSPTYYISRKKLDKAILSHKRLYCNFPAENFKESKKSQNCIENPLNIVTRSEYKVDEQQQGESVVDSKDDSSIHLVTELETTTSIGKSKVDLATVKACVVALCLMSFQQLSGINSIAFFSVTIFKQASENAVAGGDHSIILDPYLASIFLVSVQIVTIFISSCLVEKLGRRILLLFSAGLISLSAGGLTIYFHLCSSNSQINNGDFEATFCKNFHWLPLVLLVSYVFAFAVAYGPLCWIVVTEILPPHVRNFMNPLAIGYSWFCGFLVTASFPLLIIRIQLAGIFLLYGSIGIVGFFFILICVPETKGLSLLQIQEFFGSRL